MKTVFVLFDSLNRHLLGCYGGTRFPTPNFDRLAACSLTFDRHYVGSLPCMPARRDMLTGRLTFLHRSWGPLEPFDNAFPELLRENGIHAHLVTDHYHYWEDGGATYHNRYSTFEFVRGQESDPWKAMVQPHWERLREKYHPRQATERFNHYIVNREFIGEEADFPSVKCFAHGREFLDMNRDADNWLLQIETFDPHEPFFAPARFKKPFNTGWNGPIRDCPRYGKVDELPAEVEELRANHYATVSLCDFLLGELLDYYDRYDLWDDTALIVTTDHGFLLGEHDFWAKNRMNMYEEIVHIPLFAHDPRRPRKGRIGRLTQSVDMHGELYQYTLMPTHLNRRFAAEELSMATLSPPFGWTKSAPVLKIPVTERSPMYSNYGPGALLENDTRLYDLSSDPGQEHPLADPATEARLTQLMHGLMTATEAPPEAFARLGLKAG
ncbi:MAG TPA: sulfatase [Stellaceae bacterium]|nr:sulfatase [Stellaceae bacterium]